MKGIISLFLGASQPPPFLSAKTLRGKTNNLVARHKIKKFTMPLRLDFHVFEGVY